MKKIKIQIWISIGFLSGLLSISLYGYVFADSSFSKDPERWGQFGDYIGGVINPIVGVLTLIVTIKLQQTLLEFSKKNEASQINIQRIQFNTTLLYDIAKEFSFKASPVLHSIELAHYSEDYEKVLASLKELRAISDTYFRINGGYFFVGGDVSQIIPRQHLTNYIDIVSKEGRDFYNRDDKNFYLDMVILFVAVTNRKLFSAIEKQARSEEIFSYS